ncbi:MAG: heat shock protein GrpE [Methanomethylovorans sp. PtaU1.Bin093]|jgi:molecular chaperone GrpE|uniref:nucleotide exchange factor GrpE n=1 Tax=Methanomethylovorans sp. PtaU1.Bin093 TaxID=1811679 RepID=UPI0009D42E6F|nr:nucleotide exchange factor GrpE [Methanomethylovorans sp. PtaU1.Bin093]OPY21051.1 MAG: heat shock protein GrpE [Methanomethylovorans sp. PtaU1.Bin093]
MDEGLGNTKEMTSRYSENDVMDDVSVTNGAPSLEEQLCMKDEEIAQLKDRLLRLTAEFDNFRKRTVREKEEFRKFASEELLLELIEVYDNFERALESAKNTDDVGSVVKGVEMVFKQFVSILEKEGLQKMECIGAEFDPHEHEAMLHVEHPDHDDNTIIDVCKPGFYLHSRVLRPAAVTVSKLPEGSVADKDKDRS